MTSQRRSNPLRAELVAFAFAMEHKLKLNDHKGGWDEISVEDLLDLLEEEVKELREAVTEGNPYEIIFEAADVANFAMMIAHNTSEEIRYATPR